MSKDISSTHNKDEIVAEVDKCGNLIFQQWYKNSLTYKNKQYTVEIIPEYRDSLGSEETLAGLLSCEDYRSVHVFKGVEKPWEWNWYKEGDI